jgi:site-specific recombinase XerD
MVMHGRSLKEVQEVIGHKEFKMTLRYAHLSQHTYGRLLKHWMG